MEKGGEIEVYCTDYNKDHLATIGYSLKTGEGKNKQWVVCGFNGFGQLTFENKQILHQFEEIQIPLHDNADGLVACSWNNLAIASGCFLHIQGFVSNCPKSLKTLQLRVPIKCLEICDKYCLVLLEDGKVYKVVLNSECKLQEVIFQTIPTSKIPQKRDMFGDIRTKESNLEIAYIACGNNITIAISTTNAVFSGTTQIFQFRKHHRIKQLKCGFEHVLLLTANGDIYAWGNGLRGQLGLQILRVEETPKLVEALAGIKIIYIAAGGWHSAALSIFGDLYTWGFNSNGQLGLRIYKSVAETVKEPSVYPLPQLIDVPTCECSKNLRHLEDSCHPIKIAAGGRHTILQLKCGSIKGSGWNSYGQLGLTEPQKYCDTFKLILKLEDENNFNDRQIVCGTWCTLIKK